MRISSVHAEMKNAPLGKMIFMTIGFGKDDPTLNISVMMDPLCRHFDSMLVADALREVAAKLETLE